MKKVILATAVALLLGSSAFAQPMHVFGHHRVTSSYGAAAAHRNGFGAYAMGPRAYVSPNSPRLTGGGNRGYNAALVNPNY